jgi:hypothetical protein
MRPSFAVTAVEFLLEENAPNLVEAGWKVEITERPQRRLGLCIYSKKLILLSEKFVLVNEIDRIKDCGLHEIAHAMVGPGNGHNLIWKSQAIALGIKGERCDSDSNAWPGKYLAICPTCTQVYWFYRKPKRMNALRWCRKCGRVKGELKIKPYTPEVEVYEGDLDSIVDEI